MVVLTENLELLLRYISQRYSMPYREVSGLLTDIGTEDTEMFHYIQFFSQ